MTLAVLIPVSGWPGGATPRYSGSEVGKPGQSSPDRVKTEVVALSR